MNLVNSRCPGCGAPRAGVPRLVGRPCHRCDAEAVWERVPDPVRAEFDALVRAGRNIQAIQALRAGVEPPPDIGQGQSLVTVRRDVLGLS